VSQTANYSLLCSTRIPRPWCTHPRPQSGRAFNPPDARNDGSMFHVENGRLARSSITHSDLRYHPSRYCPSVSWSEGSRDFPAISNLFFSGEQCCTLQDIVYAQTPTGCITPPSIAHYAYVQSGMTNVSVIYMVQYSLGMCRNDICDGMLILTVPTIARSADIPWTGGFSFIRTIGAFIHVLDRTYSLSCDVVRRFLARSIVRQHYIRSAAISTSRQL